MKKIGLIITMFCICFSVFPQETEKIKTEARNEIKLNLLMTLFSFPDISYERIWNNNLGLGLSAGFPIESSDVNFLLLPYCRFYFGESSIKSFFIEANVGIQGRKNYVYDSSYYSARSQNTADLGLGVAFGYKYVNSSGFIGELFMGIGRTTNNDVYSRIGISIGKQF